MNWLKNYLRDYGWLLLFTILMIVANSLDGYTTVIAFLNYENVIERNPLWAYIINNYGLWNFMIAKFAVGFVFGIAILWSRRTILAVFGIILFLLAAINNYLVMMLSM